MGKDLSSEPLGRTSSSLLNLARAADAAAWDRLVALYAPLVYEWLRVRHIPSADAPDIGQEIFRRLFRSLHRFRPDGNQGSFRRWLRTITENRVRTYIARQKKRTRAAGGTDHLRKLEAVSDIQASDIEVLSESTERKGLLERALTLLRSDFADSTWQAFLAVVVESRAPAAVAADLGITLNAVYLAKNRVLRRLREEFRDLLD